MNSIGRYADGPCYALETLEHRWVLSAPPVLGDIPAVLYQTEGPPYVNYSIPVTDDDTPLSSLTFSATTTSGSWYIGFSGTWMTYMKAGFDTQCAVTLTVADDAGNTDLATFTLQYQNLAPSISPESLPVSTGLVGCNMTYSPDIVEMSNIDIWWDFGDGTVTPVHTETFGMHIPNYSRRWFKEVAQHTFTTPGLYDVRMFVRDAEGAVSTAHYPIQVVRYMTDVNGTLHVAGTERNDSIHVSPAAGGKVNLFLDGGLKGAFAANSVIAWGNGGDDVLDANEWLAVPVEFHGGAGHDLIRGGMGNDILLGEQGNDRLEGRSGHDILVGGEGNDRLRGCNGRDLLLGGSGFDSLYGDADDDIVIAGTTFYDGDLWALGKIRDEWISARPYGVRVDNIRTGTGSGDRVNDHYYFKAGTTVFDDGTEDWLCGVGGTDWFFADTGSGDKLMDRVAGEAVDVI